jgi:hypothetical protein
MWDYNQAYQTPIQIGDVQASPEKNLSDPRIFKQCLGNNSCYFDFLQFFDQEVAEKGVQATLQEYLLKRDDRANDIFCRMFSGE